MGSCTNKKSDFQHYKIATELSNSNKKLEIVITEEKGGDKSISSYETIVTEEKLPRSIPLELRDMKTL